MVSFLFLPTNRKELSLTNRMDFQPIGRDFGRKTSIANAQPHPVWGYEQ